MTAATIGDLIRRQRGLARRSQLDLAYEIGVSPRHLSFVELGKSKPSPGLLMRIAEHLDLPLRERNDWLLAAGYAPRYPETPLTGPALSRVREPGLAALADEIATWPAIPDRQAWAHLSPDEPDDPVLSWRLDLDGAELSMFTMLSTFGTPMDVTLADLFFPADEHTEAVLRQAAAQHHRPSIG